MALELVIGPANSGKAGVLLSEYRSRLDEEPILVVPSLEDVEHTQRELADGGAVFGTRVWRFEWLFEEVARRAGFRARRASDVQRELIVEEAVGSLELQALARSARQPGFVRATVRLVAELERSMVEPARFTQALRDWAGDGPRQTYAREVAAIYSRYRQRLEEAGLSDPELFSWRALDALRRDAPAWGRTPVFVYGFDDFTPLELDALETLARIAGADVMVSLPYERGRVAFKAVSGVFEDLSALADGPPLELPPVSDHYAPESRDALHHLERSLFGDPARKRKHSGAVRLLAAGGERAEVELVATEVLALLRAGTPPGDVAVVYRDPSAYASVVEQVFGAYGIPFALERRLPFRQTALGRAALALLRCAALHGTETDLLAYLRAPGKLRNQGLADWLESKVRVEGARSAAAARELWEQDQWKLDEIDRLARAAEAGSVQLIAELRAQLERLFSAPYKRLAHVLAGAEVEDARGFEAAAAALDGLAELRRADLSARRLHDTLADLPVRLGERPQPDRVLVATPERIRARRFHTVFVCGLEEGEFPRGRVPEPFLSDEDRRAIATATGLRLRIREDELDRERHLFYVAASRAERTLFLSTRFSDEEGNPQPSSFFLEDVRDVFTDIEPRRRSLSDIVWSPEEAPTEVEFERALAAAGPRELPPVPSGLTADELLERFREQEAFSASALETYADCPVRWLVDRVLDPLALEPDPEAMVRGRYAHEVLELTFSRLREETGSRRVTRDNLADAERIMREALRDRQSAFRLSPSQTRVRAAVRRLEFDLLAYLRHEAQRDGLFEPEKLELRFGLADEESLPAVPLEAEGISVRGMIDRIDTWNGWALVRDYKSGRSVYRAAEWREKNRLQAALYMIAARDLLGLKPAGGVYVPLAGRERRPRGLVSDELRAELGSDFFENDFRSPGEVDEALREASVTACELVRRVRAGHVHPCPDTCKWSNGGCQHPTICRHEE